MLAPNPIYKKAEKAANLIAGEAAKPPPMPAVTNVAGATKPTHYVAEYG